jgi:transcriptional regulator with XRE-family HTH domain
MGRSKTRPRGRPRNEQTKFSKWIDSTSASRNDVAVRLGVGRTYLDKLCRGASRPSLELAIEIEKLTKGEVPAADWLRVPAHTGD